MISFVERIIFSNRWTYIIKCWWFLFLNWFWNLICKSLNCRSKKLEWKWFLFKLKRAFIDIILTWSRILSFKTAVVSLSCCFTKISFIIKRIKVSPYSSRFKMTRWLGFFILKRSQINSILSWTQIISTIERKSSGFIFSPDCTCRVKMSFFIRIIMTWSKFLCLWNLLLIFHVC